MSDQSFLPGAPDPTVVTKWMGQVRAWAGVLLLFGIVVPQIPDTTLQAYVSAGLLAVGLVTAVWSWIEKKYQGDATKELVVDSSVASARSGVPVIVAVTEVRPPGVPNLGVAVPVAPRDIATATIAPSLPGTTAADLNIAEARRGQ